VSDQETYQIVKDVVAVAERTDGHAAATVRTAYTPEPVALV